MKALGLALAASLIGSMAFADETTVTRRDGPGGTSTTVKKEHDDGTTTTKRSVESTGALGCDTKSVTRTNELGDSKTKTRTDC